MIFTRFTIKTDLLVACKRHSRIVALVGAKCWSTPPMLPRSDILDVIEFDSDYQASKVASPGTELSY